MAGTIPIFTETNIGVKKPFPSVSMNALTVALLGRANQSLASPCRIFLNDGEGKVVSTKGLGPVTNDINAVWPAGR